MRARRIARVASVLCRGMLSVLLWLLPLARPVAHADGGAANLVYLAGTPAGVSVVDVGMQRVSRTFTVAGNPQGILLSLDGSLLYATQPELGRVEAVDTRTGAVRCTSPALGGRPSLLTQTPSGGRLFASGGGWTAVAAIDPLTCAIAHLFRVGEPVTGLATSFLSGAFPGNAGTYQLWVASSRHLGAYDAASGEELGSYPVPAGPQRITIPPNATFLYLTTGQGAVVAFDALQKKLTPPLIAGGAFGPLDFDDSTGEVYAPDAAHQQIDVLAPLAAGMQHPPPEPVRRLALPAAPLALAIASGGQLGFAALQDGRVALLDLLARNVVATVAVGGQPSFLVSGPYPPPANTQPLGRGQAARGAFVPPALLLAALAVLVLCALAGALFLRRRRARGRGGRR